MSYIGIPPQANFSSGLLDRFTSTTGTTVTLTHDIASENDIVVFVNFVKQDSTTYSVGGTGNKTLTLGGTLVSSDIVEVHYLNIVGQTVNPSANSVGSSQLTADVITGQTALASEPADTDEFLVSDAGTLKRIDYSLIKGGGITVADQLRITANITSNTNPISANIERVDGTAQGGMTDNQMSVSSGIFTFPLTGIYFVAFGAACVPASGGDNIAIEINATTNNSSYSQIAYSAIGGDNRNQQAYCQSLVDVTDTSNVKVNFSCSSIDSGSVIYGGTNLNYTYFTFIRLGDT